MSNYTHLKIFDYLKQKSVNNLGINFESLQDINVVVVEEGFDF